jgi:hypothetical protein
MKAYLYHVSRCAMEPTDEARIRYAAKVAGVEE